jgi:ABC-type sulfate transport system permease subunit
MWCSVLVNTWRGMPFFAITLLAGLQTISPDLHEAAALDGANAWHRFWRITLPPLPVTLVVVVFGDPDLLRLPALSVLTAGRRLDTSSPPTPTRSASARDCREGAALSLFMFPVLFAVVCSCATQAHGERLSVDRAQVEEVVVLLPMAAFIVFTLFFYWMAVTAFRPDNELYATWRQPNAARCGRFTQP